MSSIELETVDFDQLERQFDDETVHIYTLWMHNTYCGAPPNAKHAGCNHVIQRKAPTPDECPVCFKQLCPKCVAERRRQRGK